MTVCARRMGKFMRAGSGFGSAQRLGQPIRKRQQRVDVSIGQFDLRAGRDRDGEGDDREQRVECLCCRQERPINHRTTARLVCFCINWQTELT